MIDKLRRDRRIPHALRFPLRTFFAVFFQPRKDKNTLMPGDLGMSDKEKRSRYLRGRKGTHE